MNDAARFHEEDEMHPMQLHIRELAKEAGKTQDSSQRFQALEREWCNCEEIRERVLMELGESSEKDHNPR